jgi:DNA-binding MarR family transcriptional regulator
MDPRTTPPAHADRPVARLAGLWELLIGRAVLFNEQVARSLGISTVDLQTFGVISRHGGPVTPTEVATTTRVLDRLEKAGYIVRSSVPADRRKVAVVVVEGKAAEVARHYAGKVDRIGELVAARTDAEVAAVISYLEDLARD